jgi:hypothetical protein
VKIDRTDIATAIAVPGLVSAAALTADSIYGTTAAAIEFGTVLAAGKLSFVSFAKKWPPALAWGSLALAGASGQAWLTGTVGGFAAWYGYAITAAAVLAGMVKHRHDTRHDQIRLEQESVKLSTALIRQQMAHHTLVQKTTPEPVQSGPNLTGRTVEETKLRTVVHELFAAELPGCTVERTRTGWTAVLDLPVNLDRNKLRAAWDRVASGMGVAGEFVLEDGALTNQLIARFIDGDPLADVVPYVRQTALADFYVVYRLVTYSSAERSRARANVLSDLHANILDVFNEYGVQIMSPNYEADPSEPKLVPKENWYPAPAKPPA